MKSAVETLNPTRVKLTVEVPVRGAQAEPRRGVQEDRRAGARSRASARARCRRASSTSGSAAARCSRRPSTTRCRSFYGEAVEENERQAARPARGRRHRVRRRRAARRSPPRSTSGPSSSCPTTTASRSPSTTPRSPTPTSTSSSTALRERFATLTGVERAAADGDFVSIDLSAARRRRGGRGRSPPTGLSYEVGSGELLDGLDEAVAGLSRRGVRRRSRPRCVGGDHAGEEADVTVDRAVGQGARAARARRRLRPDRQRVRHPRRAARRPARRGSSGIKRLQQGVQARDKVLEALLDQVEVPLPEGVVEAEIDCAQPQPGPPARGRRHDQGRLPGCRGADRGGVRRRDRARAPARR